MDKTQKTALITGITGQDGAYLASFLLTQKNYFVYGCYRSSNLTNFWRLENLGLVNHPHLRLIEYDIRDADATIQLLAQTKPDEVYNLAAQSFVGLSFDQPVMTAQTTGLGPLNILEGIRVVNPKIRFYQASTSEMFGKVNTVPQTELTPFYPRSPYGIAKLFAHWTTINYWESYNIFACSGILFNHESPLRGEQFVTRKITSTLAKIKYGLADLLELGNLDSQRDWGHARDYVVGMWAMLQQNTAETYILASGHTQTVRHFLVTAAEHAGFSLQFEGVGEKEIGIDSKSGKIIARVNPQFYRPTEVDLLIGDATKAKSILGWQATTSLDELIEEMMAADLQRLSIIL